MEEGSQTPSEVFGAILFIMKKIIGIYKITSPKGRIYIGQSVDIEKRFNDYKKLNCIQQVKLYRSFLKYGHENHVFEIITTCEIEQLNDLERYFQDVYNAISQKSGLNCKLTKTNDRSGKLSDDTKNKIGLANKKVVRKPHSAETKLKISIALKGRTFSAETKRKMSKSHQNMSEETKRKMSDARKGKKHSEETKRKIGISSMGNKSNLGRKLSDEHKQNISKSQMGHKRCLGIKHSEEHKRKNAEGHRGMKYNIKIKTKKNAD